MELQEASDYYHACLPAVQQSFSHPRVPQVYHQFVAERETWYHYCKWAPMVQNNALSNLDIVKENFPGEDPLYEYLVGALEHIEREPERHIKSEGEASLKDTNDMLAGQVQQLEFTVQQRDLVIQRKDELLRIKDQTLVANQALISSKDSIFKIRENELQQEIDRVKAHESTIAWQNRDIRELYATINQKDKNIQDLSKSATKDVQKLQGMYDSRTKEVNKANVMIRSRDNEIVELKERLRMYESTPGAFAASPPKQEVKKKAKTRKKSKKERIPQVKPEPMEY